MGPLALEHREAAGSLRAGRLTAGSEDASRGGSSVINRRPFWAHPLFCCRYGLPSRVEYDEGTGAQEGKGR